MSVADRILNALREVVVMNERLQQLNAESEKLEARTANHESRLVRIETLIELSRGGGAVATIPPSRHG